MIPRSLPPYDPEAAKWQTFIVNDDGTRHDITSTTLEQDYPIDLDALKETP